LTGSNRASKVSTLGPVTIHDSENCGCRDLMSTFHSPGVAISQRAQQILHFASAKVADRTPIKSGLTPQSPFQGFCIGHRVLLQPTSGGAQCILHEAFIVRLRGRCRHGLNQITLLITSITQPSFFIRGKADGMKELYPLSVDQFGAGLPGLVGSLELDNVGHWVQHEASAEVSDQLVKFLRTANPS
jgi:pimeloyl-ACP methyl ester carboxylesterase